MIPDFKTYIKESIWSDIQDRSSGEITRKEDDINLLDIEGMCEYLNSHYRTKYTLIVIDKKYNEMIIPIVYRSFPYYITVDFTKHHISVKDVLFLVMPYLKDIIEKEFKLSKYETRFDQSIRFRIEPKDGSETTNRFLLDVIDFINSKISTQKKCLIKKRLNESIWSDIQDRSSGEIERKEDDINLLDKEGLIDYLKSHYSIDGNSISSSLHSIGVPVLKPAFLGKNGWTANVSLDYTPDGKKEVTIFDDFPDYFEYVFKRLKKEYPIYHNSGISYVIQPKSAKEECTNKFFIEVIDFIINTAKRELVIKKI